MSFGAAAFLGPGNFHLRYINQSANAVSMNSNWWNHGRSCLTVSWPIRTWFNFWWEVGCQLDDEISICLIEYSQHWFHCRSRSIHCISAARSEFYAAIVVFEIHAEFNQTLKRQRGDTDVELKGLDAEEVRRNLPFSQKHTTTNSTMANSAMEEIWAAKFIITLLSLASFDFHTSLVYIRFQITVYHS